MNLRLAFALGAVLGLLAACGATQPSPYGTSLFVTVRWDGTHDVASLFFIGQAGGHDAFPRSLRPEVPEGVLGSPQLLRVLLADDLVGQPVDLEVLGYAPDGGFVVRGEATSPALVAHDEVAVTVNLDQTDPGLDAGSRDGGGGVSIDGGSGACACATACCLGGACAVPGSVSVPDSGLPTLPVLSCGKTQASCTTLCDPMESLTCRTGKCTCGAAVCSPGQRCALVANVPTCVCDALSRCDGCCAGPVCTKSDAFCGAGGLTCANCGTGARCSAQGLCLRNLVADGGSGGGTRVCTAAECQTELRCTGWSQGDFPRCRAQGLRGECVSCDPLRSDRCSPANLTPIAVPPSPCSCGASPACGLAEYCDRAGPTHVCKPLAP